MEKEIARIAHRLNWSTVEHYKKHVDNSKSFDENLLALLRLEDEKRENETIKRRIKQAGFPIVKTLDTFEYDPVRLPHLNHEEIMELAICSFIEERTNVCALGNSGTGKTHLMTAIAVEAIRRGYSVRFYRACDLVTKLVEAETEKKLSGMLNVLAKCQLLCLDELGYMNLNQTSATLLFQVLANRYEIRSTMITTNLEFSRWPEFIGDSMMTTALVDRLVHRSSILNMNGDGYRLKQGGRGKTGTKK